MMLPKPSAPHPNASATKHVNRPLSMAIQGNNNISSPQTKQAKLHKTQHISPNHIGKHNRKSTGKHYDQTHKLSM